VGKQIYKFALSLCGKGVTKEPEVLDLESLAFSEKLGLDRKEMLFANFIERIVRAVVWSFQSSPGTLLPDAHPMCGCIKVLATSYS